MSPCLLHFVCGIVLSVSIYAGCFFQVILSTRGMVVDRTLTEGWSGVNVVVAVLEKIDASKVFHESDWFRRNSGSVKSFLRIMAYARSEDGRNTNVSGGIWGVTMNEFSETTSHIMNNERLTQAIYNSSLLQVNWIEDVIGYENMSIPLYSGLAVMLRLDKLFQENAGLQFNEDLWCMHFSGDLHKWRKAKSNIRKHENCKIKSDIVFVLDSSNSISQEDLEDAKYMVHNFTSKLSTKKGDNRIGIILIKTTADVYHSLGDGLTNDNVNETLNEIDQIPYVEHHLTNTADALCKLTQQQWRKNISNVIQVAIILSDGNSNHDKPESDECGDNLNSVADYVQMNHSYIVVFAVGIGSDVNNEKLSLITSGNHLIKLRNYNDVATTMGGTLHYQICYTVAANLDVGTELSGGMAKHQIMRWILNGVGGAGVTVRLCVRSGRITFYTSIVTNPSEVLYTNRGTAETSNLLAIDCSTLFEHSRPHNYSRKKRSDVHHESIYISIVGDAQSSRFHLQTVQGNVTLDTDECKEHPYPCHMSATCHNTDGSFYCQCKEGLSGDGFQCSDVNATKYLILIILIIIIPLLIIPVIIWRLCRHSSGIPTSGQPVFKLSDILAAKAKLRKVGNNITPVYATNPLASMDAADT